MFTRLLTTSSQNGKVRKGRKFSQTFCMMFIGYLCLINYIIQKAIARLKFSYRKQRFLILQLRSF